jgi:hypothetical protein
MGITFENLMDANRSLKATPVKGNDYIEVNQRIKAFRMLFPNGNIETEILSLENGVCVMRATAFDEEGKKLATGHAYEKEDSSYINKTSYIENCETSAVGRALGMIGIGIDTSVASYEEVSNAIQQQELNKPANKAKIATLKQLCNKHKVDAEKWLKQCNRTWDTLTEGEATKMLLSLKEKYGD